MILRMFRLLPLIYGTMMPWRLLLPWAAGALAEDQSAELEGVMSSLNSFCPHLDEIPEIFTTFWQRLHSSVVQLE
eukprot:s3036_g4.t2